jgi:hypothetical protein
VRPGHAASPDEENGWYGSPVTLAWSGFPTVQATQTAAKNGCVDETVSTDGTYDRPCGVTVTTTATGAVVADSGLVSETFKLDATAPSTTATLTPTAIGAWYSPRTVTLDAQDATSGVASTEYPVDGGAWTEYSGPFFVATYGPHSLDFRSTDVAGNVEATENVSWGSDFDASEQIQGLSDFLAGMGLEKGLANDLQGKLDHADRELARSKDACNPLDDFLAKAMDSALQKNPKLTVDEARQLLSANQIEVLLGCIPADSPAPAAESDLLDLGATIDRMEIDQGLADDLGNRVREIGKQVATGHFDQACHQLSDLSKKIADSTGGKKPKLTAAQAALLRAEVANTSAGLGC